jgi:signal transduction histidine kinase
VGLIPILTGAVYFEMWGAFAMGAAFAAWQYIVLGILQQNPLDTTVLTSIGSTILLGMISGIAGNYLMRRLRRERQTRMDADERRQRVENERLRAIYELTSTLTATLSYKRVLDSALDLGYTALNPNPDPEEPIVDEKLVSAVFLFNGDDLTVGSARRFTNADMRVQLRGNDGVLKRIFDTGEAILTRDIGYDPELGRIIALRSCSAAYCFPLRSGFNVYGAMLFAHPDSNYFTKERRGLLDIIGRQSVIAVQNARLYQDLVEEKERMIDVQEETRKKLARDLHDGPTQSVAAIAMRINLARRMMKKNIKGTEEELEKIEELAHRTTKEVRHMLFTLRPLILESQGLTAALEAMAEKMRETYGQNVIINVDEKVLENMEMGKQGVIFYIIEEATNNARKHASAVHIWVRLRSFETGIALLEIEDDGVGFNVEAVHKSYDKRGSLGMVNLRERTELVNGLLNIDSAPGKGTRIQVYIPLTEEAADELHHAKR